MNIRHFVSAIVIFAAGFVLSTVMGSRSLLPSAKSTEPAVAAQITQTPSTAQRWEYRVVSKRSGDKKVDVEKVLNNLAEQGFEVGWMKQSGSDSIDYQLITIVLRRSKQ